jgi:cytochrome c biogenesis protein CcmG, thiol:disulfide interchange protein DsbE
MKQRARTLLVGGAVVLVIVLMFAGTRLLTSELSLVEPGSKAPNFEAVTLDSVPRIKSLDEYRGKVVLLNVWATWCQPCRVEMPSIEALHKSLGPKGLQVLAVSVDEPGFEKQIRDFAQEYRLTFQILYDPDTAGIRKRYQITGYPETFIIGKDGLIRRKLIGATDWNSKGNRALIEHLLAEETD